MLVLPLFLCITRGSEGDHDPPARLPAPQAVPRRSSCPTPRRSFPSAAQRCPGRIGFRYGAPWSPSQRFPRGTRRCPGVRKPVSPVSLAGSRQDWTGDAVQSAFPLNVEEGSGEGMGKGGYEGVAAGEGKGVIFVTSVCTLALDFLLGRNNSGTRWGAFVGRICTYSSIGNKSTPSRAAKVSPKAAVGTSSLHTASSAH